VVFRAVQKDYVRVSFQRKVLESVIKHNHIAAEQLMSRSDRINPLAPHDNRDIG
jgi:hypothetical protein